MNALSSTGAAHKPEQTLADRITAILRGQIRNGIYPVNARLPTEKFMTQEFGVSRTVVREAISRLKSEGLVTTQRGSGTVVLPPSSHASFKVTLDAAEPIKGVTHIIELRCGIEAQMAALAALNHTDEELWAIRQALAQIDVATDNGKDGVSEDLNFHMAIARATHNPHYPSLLRLLTHALKDAIRVTRSNEARAEILARQVQQEHMTLVDAIAARDTLAARQAALKHMHNTLGRIKKADASFWQDLDDSITERLVKTKLDKP